MVSDSSKENNNQTNAISWQKRKNILMQVWRLALPVMLTNFLQTLVGVVDVFMVGRLGPVSIAAVGMSNAVRILILVMLLSVATGAMSLIAQAKGARDAKRMSFVTRQAISSGLLLSFMLGAAGYLLANPLLTFANSGGEAEAVELGTLYLQLLFLGTPFMVLNIIFNKLMQGAGDTVTPLLLTALLNVVNIVLNYSFMFGIGPIPAFGLQGAAMGTILARFLGVLIAFMLIYSGKNVIKLLPGSYRPDWRMFRDILSIGVPSGIQGVFRNGSRFLAISIVTATEVGTYGAAALAIGFQVQALAFMPVLGINIAGTALVGQALGSWQPKEARIRGGTGIWLGVVVMIVLATPILIFAEQILNLFDPSAHPILQRAGVEYIRISSLTLPLTAIAMVANGNLRGAGDTLPGMISTIMTRGVLTVALSYLLAFPLGFGSTGVWMGIALGNGFDAFYLIWRWYGQSGKAWLKVALHKSQLYRQHLHHLPEATQQQYLRDIRTPLMAQPTVQEHVEDKQVVYTQPDGNVTIEFSTEGYRVVEGGEMVGVL